MLYTYNNINRDTITTVGNSNDNNQNARTHILVMKNGVALNYWKMPRNIAEFVQAISPRMFTNYMNDCIPVCYWDQFKIS